jgi:tripartite-type tricarboxylate transporter receptor subunit TctC
MNNIDCRRERRIERRHTSRSFTGMSGGGIILSAVLTAAILYGSAQAASYPDRFVTLVVPAAPGGPSDVIARIIQGPLAERLGQPVVIENRGGAASNIGMRWVARARADGYTLLMAPSSLVVNPSLYKNPGYELKELVPIADLAVSPNIFLANPASGIKSIADLVKIAQEKPGTLNYGTPGLGSSPSMSFELLKLRAQINMVHVPYPGAGPTIQAVLGNIVPFASTALPPAHPHVIAGKLIALAVTSETRWPDLPDVPTVMESGFPGFVTENINVVLAPVGTPQDVVNRLESDLIAVMQRPDVREKLNKFGFSVVGKGAQALRERIDREVAMWKDLIVKAGIPQN